MTGRAAALALLGWVIAITVAVIITMLVGRYGWQVLAWASGALVTAALIVWARRAGQ